jgi:diguanylate cyclase (GGDEF)-like protein
MRRFILKLVVPIVLLFAMVGIACYSYALILKRTAAVDELSIIADELADGLYTADLIVKTASDYQDEMSLTAKKFNFYTDKKDITELLEFITQAEGVAVSMVCDAEGSGYDSKGKQIDIRDKDFFNTAQSIYSKGGSGLISIIDETLADGRGVALVNQVDFKDQVKGYLISIISVRDFSDIIFRTGHRADRAVLISLGGDIIAESERADSYGGEELLYFWDNVPENMPIDSIKLSISQKKRYVDEIKGYGYVVVAPSKVTQGAAVLLMKQKSFDMELGRRLSGYKRFVFELYIALTMFIAIMMLLHAADKHIKLKILASWFGENNSDKLTGLLNEHGIREEIDKYLTSSNAQKGLLFVINIDGFNKIREEVGDEPADMAIIDFSGKLSQNYRASDLVARLSDDKFAIFMKDIVEDKDMRKQVDELQMFLYDMRTEEASRGMPIKSCVGAAVCPKDGSNVDQLLKCATEAMESAKMEGRGRISFYK